MPHVRSGLVALILALLTHPAFAQLTEQQASLIRQLPPPDRVLAAVEPRGDAFETTLLRAGILQEFSRLAQSIGPRPLPRELETTANQYWKAASELQAQIPRDPASQQRALQLGETLFGTPKAFYQYRRELFGNVLDGELRDYALAWHDSQLDVRAALGKLPPEWMSSLPPELRAVLDRYYANSTLYLAVLFVWLVLGIALGTTPFHLVPGNVWTLQRGRRRRPMAHRVSAVVDVREAVEESRSVHRPVDGHGNPTGPDQVSMQRFHHMKLFVRSKDGEHVIQLTNQPFDARAGHRLLEVYDDKAQKYLFLYNYDLERYLSMPRLRPFVKMRPWILLPVWALAALATLQFWPAHSLTALWATPIVYLVVMGLLNRRRHRKFMREMAPKMVEATSAADSEYLGTAEYGIARA